MADLVITAANVTPATNAAASNNDDSGTANVTITAGQSLYLDSVSGQMKLAKADTLADAAFVGVSLHAALAGQPIKFRKGGALNLGAILTAGQWYTVSRATAGNIAPVADLQAGDFGTLIGYAVSTSVLILIPIATGIAHG